MSDTPPTLRDLFSDALDIWHSAASGSDYAAIWPILDEAAARHAGEAMEIGPRLLQATKPENRAVAVDLLGRVAAAHSETGERVAASLLSLLEKEQDVDVVWSILNALASTSGDEVTEALAGWALHADVKDLRIQAVKSLGEIHSGGRHTREGVAVIIQAMSDVEEDVRSWATLVLGTFVEVDDDDIRAALARRLFDTDDSTRLEAILGLARRKDVRALEAVRQALAAAIVPRRIFDAAALLGAPELVPLLESADRRYIDDEAFAAVMEACKPSVS